MIMEITEPTTMRAAPSTSVRHASAPARNVTMQVETHNLDADHESNQDDASDRRGDKGLIRKLAACSLFQDYRYAFGEATGLPLALRSVEDWQLAHANDRHQNAFCALVARNNHSCAGCLRMQQQVCNTANG